MSSFLKTIASYVPDQIIEQLSVSAEPPVEPQQTRFPAAVLFADISGFTALGERLAGQGVEGAESLTQALNDYFGQVVALVTALGGDVVKFAGDALLALWPALHEQGAATPGEALALATARAAQCGMALQTTAQGESLGGEISLTLKIGIGAGEVLGMHLGGVYRRWEYLVAGEPILQASGAEDHAAPGQVVLARAAWELVAPFCAGTPRSPAAVRLDDVLSPVPMRPG
ncbi:MAG TPA: adenylate/guanylate cyclase domain-containing protein, partial [Herpetosiphonaceae bacterium]